MLRIQLKIGTASGKTKIAYLQNINITGGKTGFTKRAKRTLVTTATKGDMSLIAVTLNGPDDWNDHISMYENGFKGYDMVEVSKGKIDIGKNKIYEKHLYVKKSIVYPATSDEMDLFSVKYKLNKPEKKWTYSKKIETDCWQGSRLFRWKSGQGNPNLL